LSLQEGEGYGHTHHEQEARENDVGETEHVFVHFGMEEPMGDLLDTRNVVHKKHQKHGDGTKHINSGYACGLHKTRFLKFTCHKDKQF
jgi:hypothetical protein